MSVVGSPVVGHQNTRWIHHRVVAHRMHRRGQPLDVIAEHLKVHKRSVNRYLALPCPEPVPAEPQVDLASFYSKGACNAFPEIDWFSRSPLGQADAKAVCAHCPVLAGCRTYGLTKGREDAGVWGGLTKEERRRELRRQRQRRCHERGDRDDRRGDVVAAQQGVA